MTETAVAEAPVTSTGKQEIELFRQSYLINIPKTQAGLEQVFTDPATGVVNTKALLLVVRSGMKQIINNRVRQLATSKDEAGNPAFEVVDGIYNATPLILQAPQRQNLSQREKTLKNLQDAGLPQAAIEQMLAVFDKNVGVEENSGDVAADTNEFVVYGKPDKEGKTVLSMRTPRVSDEEEE